jgi:hypothetical protein
MDGNRFDRVTKPLASETSRRRVVQGFARGLAAAALLALGREQATAAPNDCAVACAEAHGASGANCRQVCKQCNNQLGTVGYECGAISCIPRCCNGENQVPTFGCGCCATGQVCQFVPVVNAYQCVP